VPTTLADALSEALHTSESACEAELARAEAELSRLAHAATDLDLVERAMHQEAGDTPLLGTSLQTHVYPALIWNGERFERLQATWPARLAFLVLATAGKDFGRSRSARAITVGEAVRRNWPQDPESPVTGLTTSSVGAAVCAAIAAGVPDDDLEAVAEVAAAVMLVTPVRPTAEVRESHAGHALASGWLAVQLFRSGVVAAPGTAAEVLGTQVAP